MGYPQYSVGYYISTHELYIYERDRKDVRMIPNFIKFLLRKEDIYKIERKEKFFKKGRCDLYHLTGFLDARNMDIWIVSRLHHYPL